MDGRPLRRSGVQLNTWRWDNDLVSCAPISAKSSGVVYDYIRSRDLPRLIPLIENELATPTPEAHCRLLARIRRALRVERQRGRAGCWSYSVCRHRDLARAYRKELALFAQQNGRRAVP